MSHQASDIITPKALLLDERLTPLERNAWLTFRALAGPGSLIPAHKTYIQQRHVYDGQCKAAGLSNMHGLGIGTRRWDMRR